MKVKNGVIYLAEPLFGRQILTGPFVVMTNWVDYTFAEKLSATTLGLPEDGTPPSQVRLLIPLTNIRAVLTEREENYIPSLSITNILQEV